MTEQQNDPENYTDEEIQQATAELGSMTPEALLELTRTISALENVSLPEAGGIAWTELQTPRGAVINLTSRAHTPLQATENLLQAIKALNNKYHILPRLRGAQATPHIPETTVAVAPPPPAGVPTPPMPQWTTTPSTSLTPSAPVSSDAEVIAVDTIAYALTKGNVPYVRVKGGHYAKWGVAAYPEVIPVGFDLGALNGKGEVPPPANMRLAIYSPSAKKVVAFQS